MPSRDDTRPAKLADSSHDYPGEAVDPPLEEAQAALVRARRS
jgi:hypothetical protein